MVSEITTCELCQLSEVLIQNSLAYVRYNHNSLSPGHVLVIPKRYMASFFEMTAEEESAVLELPNRAQESIQEQFASDGYNIGVNVGKADGQPRMHVHVHLTPRYASDVADPRGGIRCVLDGKTAATR